MTSKDNNQKDIISVKNLQSELAEFEKKQGQPNTRKCKEDLTESEKRSRAWLENSPVCTKIIDADFNLQYMSCAGIEALKIENIEDYYGKPYPISFFSEDAKAEIRKYLEKVKNKGEMITAETPVFDIDGNQLSFQSTFTRVNHKNGDFNYIMVVSTEITQLKIAEATLNTIIDELHQTNDQLIKSKKQAEESDELKSAFLANMSHEIRTPLNAVLGFTNLIRTEKDLPASEREQFFKLIDSGGQRLLRIIDDILDISKIDVKQLSTHEEACSLNELIDILQQQFSMPCIEKKLSLQVSKGLPDDRSIITIDSIRLSQILSNLLENACKFTKEGEIKFGYTLDGQTLHFHVKDAGSGIAPKDHESIFERFRQTDDNHLNSGSGLGLAISKELVHLMNGNIWVESEKGKGASFYFDLPYKPDEDQTDAPPSATTSTDITSEKYTILIAENEPANFLYLSTLLKGYNYRILHAKDGLEALDLLKENHAHLILMDIRMPKMDGLEATKEIRKISANIPIVGQSAYVMPEDIKAGYDAGMNSYLKKPITRVQLKNIITKHLESDTILRRGVRRQKLEVSD